MASGPSRKTVIQTDLSATQIDSDEAFMKKHGYILSSTLGKGSYAKVKAAYKEKDRKKFAIKIMDRRKAAQEFRDKFLPREIAIAPELKHPNIIECFGIYQNKDKIYMVLELASGGDMLRYIRSNGSLSEPAAGTFYAQICDALEFLHSRNICHRDLKCENLLLDADQNIKLSDFGFARVFQSERDFSSTFCGSAAYAAPEVLQAKPYDARAYDVWSSGVILFIMVCGFMPYDDTSIRELIRQQNEKLKFPRDSNVSKDCRTLIRQILHVDPKKRAKISEIKTSSWMRLASPAKTGHARDAELSSGGLFASGSRPVSSMDTSTGGTAADPTANSTMSYK